MGPLKCEYDLDTGHVMSVPFGDTERHLSFVRRFLKKLLNIGPPSALIELLDGGRTAHSTLKLPMNLQASETPTCNVTKNFGMG